MGKGAFSTAVLCNKRNENNGKYVIKIMDTTAMASKYKTKQMMYDAISNEIFILDILRTHCEKYIMCYVKTIIEGPTLYIVCEYLENYKSLDTIYKTDYHSVDVLAKLYNNLLMGMDKIHSLNICHRDIKPANIMYNTQTYDIKFIDFGMSLLFINDITRPNVILSAGTPNYLYPPFYAANLRIANVPITMDNVKKADNFALGMVVFMLLSKGKTMIQYVDKVRKPDRDDILNFNENMDEEYNKPILHPIYRLENQVAKYARENNMMHKYFSDLFELTSRPDVPDEVAEAPVPVPVQVPVPDTKNTEVVKGGEKKSRRRRSNYTYTRKHRR